MHAVKRLSPFLPFSQCLFISHARSTQILISRRNNHIKAEDAKEITVPLPYGQIAGKLKCLMVDEILLLIILVSSLCTLHSFHDRVY